VVIRKNNLLIGVLLLSCAREVPSEMPSAEGPLLGEPCALSSAPQVSSQPRRIFVELATLQGDLASVQETSVPSEAEPLKPRTFSQMLAEPLGGCQRPQRNRE